MSSYEWPPSDEEKADDWSDEHPFDAVAYAAHWTHSGDGYGPERAKASWPDCPGFDWQDGVPDWSGIDEESGYEYRTVLASGDAYGCYALGKDAPEGWELVEAFNVNPEPELFDDDGNACGCMYIGEGNAEIVYRRKLVHYHARLDGLRRTGAPFTCRSAACEEPEARNRVARALRTQRRLGHHVFTDTHYGFGVIRSDAEGLEGRAWWYDVEECEDAECLYGDQS